MTNKILPVTLKHRSYGIILFHRFPRSIKYLILKHKKGHWAFPKGHGNGDESKMETALRELYEETKIKDIRFITDKIMLKEKYIYYNRRNQKIDKIVEYFVAESGTTDVKICKKEILNYKWLTLNSAEKIITFEQSKQILKEADKIVTKTIFKTLNKNGI